MNYTLNEKTVLTFPVPTHKENVIYYDSKLPCFGVKVTKSGKRTFILRKRFNGIDRKIKIGDIGNWTVAAAREEARELMVKGDKGIDPQLQRYDERNAPTFAALWKVYSTEILSTKAERNRNDQESMYRTYIEPEFRNKRVKDIGMLDIQRLHRIITESGKSYRANRILEVMKSCMNLANRLEWREGNPCSGIKKNLEQPRHRYLTDDEIKRLKVALDSHVNQRFADIVRLLLLTGSRRGEVLSATWDQFDLDKAVWTKPSAHTKQRREHRVPLSPSTVNLLQEIRRMTNSIYVFPQDGNPESHVVDIKKFWRAILMSAEIENFRIHDLRHAYASVLVSAGMSLSIIGGLLGHTQAATTMRYAHLMDHPLRNATNKAADLIGL